MWYVYVIKSVQNAFAYIGSTNDVTRRFEEHNNGTVQSTKAYLPFEKEGVIGVKPEQIAHSLEKYFKTGSGKAVLRKRFLSENL